MKQINNKWIGGLKEKPDWDTYFITQAFLSSQRSIDENTCHGAIIVDWYNRIISQGYNGPRQGKDDTKIPTKGPEKYKYFTHAEDNAIKFAQSKRIDLRSCRLYVTGLTCSKCAELVVSSGIKTVICGPVKSKMITEQNIKKIEQFYKDHEVKLEYYNKTEEVKKLLNKTLKYLDYKEL